MEKVIKVTYLDGYDMNRVKAKQFTIYGWVTLYTEMMNKGIQENWVLKIEVVLDVVAVVVD